jgi:PAS domain S-box-containing protein
MEEKVREHGDFLQTLFDTIPNPIFYKDATGRYSGCNRAFLEFTGKPMEEILGKTVCDIGPRDIADKDEEKDRKLFEHPGKQQYEWKVQNALGEVRQVIFDKATLLDTHAAVSGLIGVISDITERKRAEAEKIELEKRLRRVEKTESLGRMAGSIAHLFNNHLSVVMGNLELALMDLSGNATIRENLTEAMRAASRSSEISGLMLTYLGQGTTKGEPLDLSELCRQNLPRLQDAMPKGIALKADLLGSGPVVRANANEMQQVLTHLITNGWESIGHSVSTVTLATRIIPASEISKSYLIPVDWKPTAEVFSCLGVTDTGCGIAEEDLDKIFDPFFTTKFAGRGLGLAVVLGIVRTRGGAIGVESRKNQGSTFRVFLPLVTDELPRSSEKATEAHQMEPGGTVLLVEDQDIVRNMAESMLKRLGYEVLAASGGTEAVKLLRENTNQVRCVITDLSMPGMDGWETLSALRKIQPHIPVILVSGYDETCAMGTDYPERPHVFLHKPYLKSDLESAIDTALKNPVSKG